MEEEMATQKPILTIPDYEARAWETMPEALLHFDRLFGTNGAPITAPSINNLAAFEALRLRPRVLVDVSHRDLSTEVLGQKISFPVMLAPIGIHQLAHPEGELASARAAGAAGTIMGLSTGSSYTIEEVADVATGPLWFQLYFFKDRELTETLVRRAERAGYTALVLTVDNLGAGSRREVRDHSFGYAAESERTIKNLVGLELPNLPTRDNLYDHLESALNWSDLEWLRSITPMPLVIKGIQTAEDARLCVDHGADGLVVSNHGGHSVEGGEGTVGMLPEVVDAAGDRVEVLLDGGVRRGADILKALALGAKAVCIARPIFWGLSIDGEAGVRRVLDILRDELDMAMGRCGVTDIKKVDRSLVVGHDGGRRGDHVVGQLERLASLLERGYMTREEFETQKVELLRA
jgi:4-hydroxymandelate oxidase